MKVTCVIDFRRQAEEKVGLKWIEQPKNWDEAMQNYKILEEETKLKLRHEWAEYSKTSEGKEWHDKLSDVTSKLEALANELKVMFKITYRGKTATLNRVPKLGAIPLLTAYNYLEQSIAFFKKWIEMFEQVKEA